MQLPQDLDSAKKMLNNGYSFVAVAMEFGPVGSHEYYEARQALGDALATGCPHCGEVCMGTGDCNCQEE